MARDGTPRVRLIRIAEGAMWARPAELTHDLQLQAVGGTAIKQRRLAHAYLKGPKTILRHPSLSFETMPAVGNLRPIATREALSPAIRVARSNK
jgi:hypothetical protein